MNKKEELALIISEHGQRMISAMQDGYEYMYSVEQCFSRKRKKLQEKINEKSNVIDETKRKAYLESYGWELHQNQYRFPDILCETVLLGIYHGFEYGLNTYCEYFRWLRDYPLKFTDLHGNGVERSNLYLKKVVGVSFDNLSNLIGFIRNLNALRNCIVHAGGDLPSDPNARINKFVMDNEHLLGEPNLSVAIRPTFIPFMIEQLSSFIQEIDGEIKKNLQSRHQS